MSYSAAIVRLIMNIHRSVYDSSDGAGSGVDQNEPVKINAAISRRELQCCKALNLTAKIKSKVFAENLNRHFRQIIN